tara:strand:- start:6117 stop:6542 length:426 start_codon:yes stop_codon:yes gene_type:complete
MKLMKILLVLCFTLFYGKILLAADFTLTQSIKWTMGSEIETPSGKLRGVSVEGTYIDSRGYKGTITCIGSVGEKFSADCHFKDEDGDIIYADALRKGTEGVSKMSGGTGKYKNINSDCVYQIANSNREASLGLVTMQCSTN